MLSVTALRWARSFRSGKLTDDFELVIAKKAVPFDYVAIDVGSLVGGALRLTRSVAPTEQRRAKEVGRLVSQHLLQLLRRVQPTRALFLTLDGAAPLWVAAAARLTNVPTRRLEMRLARLPASPLMQAVEDRVVRMLPDARLGTREIVWSGTGVAGTSEEKISAWALDVAARPGFDGTQHSLALIGGTDLYLNAWALTNYYRVSSLVERNNDLVRLDTTAVLEWLGLDDMAARGENTTVARARTDMLFLHLIAQGLSAMELSPVTPVFLPHLFDRYQRLTVQPRQATESDETSQVSAEAGDDDNRFLFEDVVENGLALHLGALIRVLAQGTRASGVIRAAYQAHVDDYLEHALQVHAQLCCGETPDDGFVPVYLQPHTGTHPGGPNVFDVTATTPTTPSASVPRRADVTVSELVAHLLALVGVSDTTTFFSSTPPTSSTGLHQRRARRRRPHHSTTQAAPNAVDSPDPRAVPEARAVYSSWSPTQPLTAAEATILSQHAPTIVEELLRGLVGAPPQPNVGKSIVLAPSVEEARTRTQTALAFCPPEAPPRAVCLGPSYCWTQARRSKLWHMAYVDVGVRGRESEVRRRGNARTDLVLQTDAQHSTARWYNASTQAWTAVPRFPHAPTLAPTASSQHATDPATVARSSALSPPPSSAPSSLTLVSWNVLFDRYSGQPTPLGMPGIDWCSPQRYPVLAKVMARENADFIGMQEVEPAFLSFLAAEPFFRDHYIFSCDADSDVIAPWGVVLLTHKRLAPFITAMEHVNIPAWSGHVKLMPVAALRLPHGTVHIAAAHLLAPFTKQNVSARTAQDDTLRRYLTKSIPANHDCLVMGDFNDWPTSEFLMPSESRYVECWPLVHPDDPGKTMDETNTFCKLKIEEIFFGRSDKFFLRSHQMKPTAAHLVGVKSVNEENDNKDAPDYLFPSDHYGVSMTFSVGRL